MNIDFDILKIVGDEWRTIIRINANTLQINIIKLEGEFYETPDQAMDGISFVKDYMMSGKVFEEDLWQFERLLHFEEMIRQCKEEGKGTSLVYRIVRKGKVVWMRMVLAMPRDFSESHPDIILYNYDLNVNEVDFYESGYTLMNTVYKIMKVNMTTNEAVMIKEPYAEARMGRRISRNMRQKTAAYVEKRYGDDTYVHPSDLETFTYAMDRERIRHHFANNNASYVFYYRRKVGTLYRWVKSLILRAVDYTPEHETLFVYIMDAHREILRILDITDGVDFTKYYTREIGQIDLGYYENLLEVLSGLTEQFVDYNMIDMERDIFVRYKVNSAVLEHRVPYVGSYSEIMSNMKRYVVPEDQWHIVEQFDTAEKVRELLQDRMTVEFTYTTRDGRKMVSTIRKLETIGDLPARALSYTMECPEEDRLTVQTFGNFEVFLPDGAPLHFTRAQSRELLAYLIDKQGYPVTSKDIVMDILEKPVDDMNAIKYVSTLIRRAIRDLEAAGYPNLIIKEQKTVRVNTKQLDCDYYHLLNGETSYWSRYHNEYMREYSWAEDTNADIQEWTMH